MPLSLTGCPESEVRQDNCTISQPGVITMGVLAAGEWDVLGFDLGASEETFWLEFLHCTKRRGLKGVRLVKSDAHEWMNVALDRTISGATRNRCRVHLMLNLLAYI
jgi:transposase-like protein